MKDWIIRRLGGFVTFDEALESIRYGNTEKKYEILTLAVKKLFNTISGSDILQEKNGTWMFKGRALEKSECELLIAQAENLLKSRLWEVLVDDVRYQANKSMFILSKGDMDLVTGKLWLFILDQFKTRLESLRRKSGRYNSK